MLIAKFALLAFLMALATMMVQLQDRPAPVGGPFYYADPEGHPNPVQPKFRINVRQMLKNRRYCQVYFDERSLPLIVKHFEDRRETGSVTYLWTRGARLKRRLFFRGGRLIRVDEVSQPQ